MSVNPISAERKTVDMSYFQIEYSGTEILQKRFT